MLIRKYQHSTNTHPLLVLGTVPILEANNRMYKLSKDKGSTKESEC